jgi:hypothetical protein
MTNYPKGSDAKIKNIEQLDNIENRGIEIRYKTNEPKIIDVADNEIYTWKDASRFKPDDFEIIKLAEDWEEW